MPADILTLLRTWGRMPAAGLLDRMGTSRATLMRAVRAHAEDVIVRGQARRTAYAARRRIRGKLLSLPLYRIDERGQGSQVGILEPVYPAGCALALERDFEWPLSGDMADGWFDGLPYPLDDMRPQGFLGRNFARRNALLLQVDEDPAKWSEDDVLHALSLLGADTPGNYILGDAAYRGFLASLQQPEPVLPDDESLVGQAYLEMAEQALQYGVVGSSAGGEFPKFSAVRLMDGGPMHVLVKFSGNDAAASAGTQRWSDLLICEHLALQTMTGKLGIAAARSRICQAGGRTFLEVVRFDRHGARGRSAMCSWSALNAALLGVGEKSWTAGARALRRDGLVSEATVDEVARIWHFGQLIANTDMHEGNLSFRPGDAGFSLALAPVYDMLPMMYAPARGVELARRDFLPQLPLPAERAIWQESARAAEDFWSAAASDVRISEGFRHICAQNADKLALLTAAA